MDTFLGKESNVISRIALQGLINEEGFQAFAKEVMVLASVKHENIVTFSGYSLEPSLLIVMEFVEGGMLKDFIASVDPMRLVRRPGGGSQR